MKALNPKTWLPILLLSAPAAVQAVLPVSDGLIVHFDPTSIVTDNGSVTGWNDLSGRGNHAGPATAPATGAPLLAPNLANGLNAVQFTGSQLLQVPGNPVDFDGINTWTWFVVMRPDVSALSSVFMNRYTDATYGGNPVGGAATRNLAWGTQVDANNVRPQTRRSEGGTVGGPRFAPSSYNPDLLDVFFISEGFWDGGAGTITGFLNGEQSAFTTPDAGITFTGHQSLSIGGAADGALGSETHAQPFTGYVAELIAFNRLLSDAERHDVGFYLGDRYGVAYVPEPSTYALIFGAAIAGLVLVARRRRHAKG